MSCVHTIHLLGRNHLKKIQKNWVGEIPPKFSCLIKKIVTICSGKFLNNFLKVFSHCSYVIIVFNHTFTVVKRWLIGHRFAMVLPFFFKKNISIVVIPCRGYILSRLSSGKVVAKLPRD